MEENINQIDKPQNSNIFQKYRYFIFIFIVFLITASIMYGFFALRRPVKYQSQNSAIPQQPTPFTTPNETNPKIIGIEEADKTIQGDIGYRIKTSVFNKPMWLCVQPDFYSKPSNKKCNSGQLLTTPKDIIFTIKGDNTVLRLYSHNDQAQLYDEVLVRDLNTKNPKIVSLQKQCGTLILNTDGNFFIAEIRLLTIPGWADLVKFVNQDICVQGESYPQASSIRVYFIEEKDDDKKTQWNTYFSEKYPFSIQYPKSFTIKEQESDIYLLNVFFIKGNTQLINEDNFSVEVTSPRTLSDELEYRKWQIVGHIADSVKQEKIQKDNYDGIRLTAVNTDIKSEIDYVVTIINTPQYNYAITSSRSLSDTLLKNLNINQ